MIDFKNLQNASYLVNRSGERRQYPISKREAAYPTAANQASASNPASTPAVADVVEISADAALKSKLSAFPAALAKEMSAISPEKLAYLKVKYAGDACPVSGLAVAGAMLDRAEAVGA
jgi:hypothetical protein